MRTRERAAAVKPRRKRIGGFTMVELLVTMLILTIGLLGLAALQLQVVRGVTDSRRSDEATRLGQTVLERYLLLPSGHALLAPSTGGSNPWFPAVKKDGSSPMDNVGVDGETSGPFTVRAMIESLSLPDAALLVSVKVSWVENATGGARPANLVLTTRRVP